MGKKINETGNIYGRLTVIEEAGRANDRSAKWKCKCECGNEVDVVGSDLRRGQTKSCGCFRRDRSVEVHTTHGMGKTPEYNSWCDMKRRCLNKTRAHYPDYGGRGIEVCDRWLNSFENFYEDMGKRPSSEHSLDRVNNEGNYTPDNCRWASLQEQNNNTRRNKNFTYKGITRTLKQWARELGINYFTLRSRLVRNNWTVEKAFNKPIKEKMAC